MLRLILTITLALVATSVFGQQSTTVWRPERGGDWYRRQNWSDGVPTFSSDAVIPSGQVVADAAFVQEGPVANSLVIGNGTQNDNNASLTVSGAPLIVPNSLTVGQTSAQSTTASLLTKGSEVRDIGDVLVGEIMTVGVVDPSNVAIRLPRVIANVAIDGELRGFDSSPSLTVGQMNGFGSVLSTMNVANQIGQPRQGFNSISVGAIGQGANGDVTAKLEAEQIHGTGQSALLVGTNFGKGHADGSLTVRDGISGFAFAQIGDGGNSGTARGMLGIGGPLDVATVEVGNKQGTGRGEVRFSPSASFVGKSFTIHPESRVSATNSLAGEVTNLGVFSIANIPDHPSTVKIEGNYSQLPGGVTELDVRNLDPDFGYERLEVFGTTRLNGRFDIRFADDFKGFGGSLEFLNSDSIEGVASVRLINAPEDSAVVTSFEKGFRLELVEPEPLKFANLGQKQVMWDDPELWGGQIPQTNNSLELINDDASFKQEVTIAEVANAQQLSLGGKGGVDLLVSEGSALTATHGVSVDQGSSLSLQNSTLLTDTLNFQRGSTFDIASGVVVGDVFNAGRIDVGASDGSRLTIEGDFVQTPTGVIEFDLLHADTFDHVVVDGAATLGGSLFINLPDVFDLPDLKPGVEIPLFTAVDGLTIEDLDIYLDGPPLNGINWLLGDDGDTITMMAISADLESRGDMNGDGLRDDDDVFAFSKALTDVAAYWLNTEISGGVHPLVPGDLNFDNQLDLDDIEPFLDCIEFGFCAPEFEVVPEPSAIHLGIVASMIVLLSQRRRNVR